MTRLRGLRPTLLDRYILRETIPPFGLGLLLFTLILLLDHISNFMKVLVSRGADSTTVLKAFLYLLPSIFSVTIPMAFLLGVLLAFGRMASDSEIVALRASGVSPARLLRPVTALATLAALVTFFVMAWALPTANQAWREIVFSLVVSKARQAVKPRVFTEDLVAGMVVYVSDIAADTGNWKDVFIYDVRVPSRPSVILARQGQLVIDTQRKEVEFDARDGVRHAFDLTKPAEYEQLAFGSRVFPLPASEFFPKVALAKGDREMTLQELSAQSNRLHAEAATLSGSNRPLEARNKWLEGRKYDVEWHKKFAIPAACFVFGLLGLGLSLGSRKEARSAAFGLSIGVIFVYYVIIRLGEQAGDTGFVHPFVSMWGANFVLGLIALVLLYLNNREPAFDPLDPSHYLALVPRIRSVRRAAAPRTPHPGRPARRVVVVRLPRIWMPVPGILDRYVARTFLGYFLGVLAAFWAIYILASFLDLFDDVQQNKVKGRVVLHYYTFLSPQIVHLLAPFAVLVAVLITFGIMSRRLEITAMKASGISLYRTIVPALVVAVALCGVMFAGSETVLPETNRLSNQDHNVIKGRPVRSTGKLDRRWIVGSDGRFYNYDYLERRPDPERGGDRVTFYGLSVFDMEGQAWRLHDRLYATRAIWNGVNYDLERGWRRTLSGKEPGFREFASARTREIEAPGYFSQEEREAETLTFQELRAYIARLEAIGLDVTALKVQLHRKLAYPAVSLVMTLIGIPFSFVVARRGALWGAGASVVLGIVYWACLAIFDAFGTSALLPAALAAWAPNLLFAATGLYLILTLDT